VPRTWQFSFLMRSPPPAKLSPGPRQSPFFPFPWPKSWKSITPVFHRFSPSEPFIPQLFFDGPRFPRDVTRALSLDNHPPSPSPDTVVLRFSFFLRRNCPSPAHGYLSSFPPPPQPPPIFVPSYASPPGPVVWPNSQL